MAEASAAAAAAADEEQKMLNKFSRQNAAFGAEVTMKLTKMQALVVGCSGIGTEVVKNLILQGIGGITLVDQKPAEIADLGVNFFLTEADIGKPTAPTLVPKFKELNPFCNIQAAEALSPELVLKHSVLIICEQMPLSTLIELNTLCRTASPKPISFVFARTGGAFGSVFVDHGHDHVVTDDNGQNPMVRLVESIESGPEALIRITVPDGQQPGTFPDGAYVEFSDIVGCDGLMEHQEAAPTGDMVTAWKLTTKPSDPANAVRIGDTSGFPPYMRGGMLTEKKVPTPMPFRSLAEVFKEPGMPFDSMVGTDMVNFGSELQVHLALHAALALEAETGAPIAEGDPGVVIARAKALLEAKDSALGDLGVEPDEEMFAKIVRNFHTPLQPFCAFLGGIVGQEVVKAAGKYTPIPGFLHLNVMEALPEALPADRDPRGTRYDHLAKVYGHGFIEQLQSLKYFMVGCGALGCEFLKNFALNGVCCGEKGQLIVTDADRIELSNLTRQFLFREHNVGQPKSRAAGEMVGSMNPAIRVRALEEFVGTKTEDSFNDDFWMGLDGVCNALDNMEARFYVDNQCVKYEKPLLESGTMGPAGNVDPVVPFKTQTYSDGGQADEGGGIPMCTLRNFPHLPDHCIEWARDQFELLFVKSSKQAKKFYDDPGVFMEEKASSGDDAQAIFEVRGMLSLLRAAEAKTERSAGQLAFDYFHLLFRDKILDLTNAFPEDARVQDPDTKQDKGLFWSGHKKFPRAPAFDASNPTHWKYLVATAGLFSQVIGVVPPKAENDDDFLKGWRNQAWAEAMAKDLVVPEYVAGAINVEGDDNADAAVAEKPDSKAILNELLKILETFIAKPMPSFEEADFEKDDDFNFHIEFITCAANLRADNYYIANSDLQKVKVIAGKIVPAVATTTAAVCGLVMFELFKVVLGMGADKLRTRQIGLAVNTYTSFEANEPKTFSSGIETKVPKASELPEGAFDEAGKIKEEFIEKEPFAACPEKHSVWDKLKVPSASMTIDGFRQWLETEHKVKLKNWSFVLGWKREEEEGKELKIPFSSQIYPPPVVLDTALFPPLDMGVGPAMMEIQKNGAIPPAQKMKYHGEWKKAKESGVLPVADAKAITADMTLKAALELMAQRADDALANGTIFPKWGTAIGGLSGRKLWVVPADQTPSCSTIPADGADPVDVRFLAALQIPLV